MRRLFLLISIPFLCLLFLHGASSDENGDLKQPRLNVLLITVDTLRADRVSCYNSQHVQTSNMDSLAERGFVFTRAFAHNPLTLPSHTNIMLGTTPLFHGVHDNVNFVISKNSLTLAEHLKIYGYATGAVIGAYPLDSRFGLNQGFDFYDDDFKSKGSPKYAPGERKAEVVVNIAHNWLKKQEGPWFLWMHIWDPHFPYEPPEPFLTQFKDRPYDGEVAYVDSVLGDFFNLLKQAGLFEKTLIVLTSDHGESLGQHGERTHGILAYNTTIWVPLIIYIPNKEHGKVRQPVSHTDIFPTICDVLGVEAPPFLQGISVQPALKAKKLPERRIYFESLEPYYNYGWAPLRGYIENNEKYFDSPIPELYFLHKDFDENQNKASTNKLENYKARLEQTLSGLTNPENIEAKSKPDRETLEKLKSLGYVGSPVFLKKEKYGPEDDVKILLPFYNEIADAYTFREEGKTEEGIELLQQIIKKQKKVYFAYIYLAKLYRESNRMQDALNILKQGLDVHPLCYEIVSLYSEYLLDAGRFDEVIDILDSHTLIRMEHDALLWNYLGLAYMKKGDVDNAIKAFETAVSVDQQYADVFVNLGRIYFSRYLRTKEKNAYKNSIYNYKKAIEVEPDNAEAFYGLGVAYMQDGREKDAIYLLEITLVLDPGLIKAYYFLGLAYLTNNNLNEAFNCLSAYKKIAYRSLSNEEKMTLDSLIHRAKPESR